MDERSGLAWLARKVGWGTGEGQFETWLRAGSAAVIDELVAPDDHGVPARPDPFAGIDREDERQARVLANGTLGWIDAAVASTRPLETFMEFFWSDYFAVSARVVRPRHWMFDHMNVLARHACGNFAELLRDVSVDPAMLQFLDGGTNTEDNPNENFGRELLELYSVGVGNFTEDDVQAAARALTGWRVRRRDGQVTLAPGRHDDSPQTLLGVTGVNDLDSTIDAVLAHPATAHRLVHVLAQAILGQGHDEDLTSDLPDQLSQDWELQPVLRRLLELGVAGHATPAMVEPVAWYVTARKLAIPRAQLRELREFFALSGQVPMQPPNVGGFPGQDAYLSTSATIARFNMAAHLAERATGRDSDLDATMLTGDVDQLAERLCLTDGFAPSTTTALAGLTAGPDRLAAALASPDLVVV